MDLGHRPSQLENPVAVQSKMAGTLVDVREATIQGMRHADRVVANERIVEEFKCNLKLR